MNRKKLISSLIVAATFLISSGCLPTHTLTPQPGKTATPSLIPSAQATATPTVGHPPSPTPLPTLSPDAALQVLTALHDDSCKLPCYLGIIPGKTTLQEGISILENLGGVYFIVGGIPYPFQRKADGAFLYTYIFDINDPISGEKLLTHNVTLITNNDIVQVVDVSGATLLPESLPTALEAYRDYWQRYSAREIFLQLGEPDYLSAGVMDPNQLGDSLILAYEERNLGIRIDGNRTENNICPEREARNLSLDMLLSYPDSTLNIYEGGGVPSTDGPTLEEVIGVDRHEFYERVLNNPSVCFEPTMVKG